MKKRYEIKKANNFIYSILRFILTPILRQKYNFNFEYETSKNIQRPCVILANHQTSFDQFAVGIGFNFGINFIASDSIFRHGLQSWLMKVIGRPIPFLKGSTDAAAIIRMFNIIKQGGSVGMFVSGNRSFYGDECTLRPGIGKLVKKLSVPVILVKLRGGFFTKPRWKNSPNKGKMCAGVINIIKPEEMENLTSTQLDEIITRELYFNEFEWNAKEKIKYRGKKRAEYLERVLFYCPQCGKMETLNSCGNEFFCTECGMRVKINESGFFEKIKNADRIPNTILEWSKIQLEYIKAFNFNNFMEKPFISDQNVRLLQPVKSKKDVFLGKGSAEMFNDRIRICGKVFLFKNLKDMSVASYNRLMIYMDDSEYTMDMPMRGNAMKYMIFSYHIINTAENPAYVHYGY